MNDYIFEIGWKALRENHCLLVETIEPKYVRDRFYQKGYIPRPTFLDDDNVRHSRAEKFLEYLQSESNCPVGVFLEGIVSQYPFLVDVIKKTYEEILEYESSTIEHKRNEPLGPKQHRAECLIFRHKLKRATHDGQRNVFISMCSKKQNEWNALPLREKTSPAGQKLADMVFMTLDAECERRRTYYDKTLVNDKKIFKDLLDISLYTTSCTLPEAMCRARFTSAQLMAGTDVRTTLKFIQDAKQKMALLPPCRESGVILYIEYNMLGQLYEKERDVTLKPRLLKLAEESMSHLTQETKDMGNDFRRIMLIKIATQCLNIGLFLDFLDNTSNISVEDMEKAKSAIREVEKPVVWSRMELRWRMSYYTCKARLCQLEGDLLMSRQFLRLSQLYANKSKSHKEGRQISNNLTCLNRQSGFSFESSITIHHSEVALAIFVLVYLFFLINVVITWGWLGSS